jgi:hypothetical protein
MFLIMVEAIVVIANGSKLLKAEESPYMMKDRPLVAYRPETCAWIVLGSRYSTERVQHAEGCGRSDALTP